MLHHARAIALRDGLLDELASSSTHRGRRGKRLFDDLRFARLSSSSTRVPFAPASSPRVQPARFAGLGRDPGRDAILIGGRRDALHHEACLGERAPSVEGISAWIVVTVLAIVAD